MSFEVKGTFLTIKPVQEFDSGFRKKEFIFKTDDPQFPQELRFELMKDNIDKINAFKEGDSATVHFNINGSEHNGRHFVNLHAWKLERG